MKNTIIVSVDKINGKVQTSPKGTEYLVDGMLHIGKDSVRASWLRPDASALGKAGLVFADVEVTHNPNSGKSYAQLTVTGVVPIATNDNIAHLVGEFTEIKELGKMVSGKFRFEHTDWSKTTRAAETTVKSFDKTSPIGKVILSAKGRGKFYVQGTLSPSNGFIEFAATKVIPFGGAVGDIELGTAADQAADEELF